MTLTFSASAASSLSRGADILADLIRIEAGEDVSLAVAPGELAALIASFREIVASAPKPTFVTHATTCDFFGQDALSCACAPAAPAPVASVGTRAAPRVRSLMPDPQVGPDGKSLPLLLFSEAVGPFIVGHNTPGGWRIRDVTSNTDGPIEDRLRWKAVKKDKQAAMDEAFERLTALDLDAEEIELLAQKAGARIMEDGTAR